MVQVKIKAKAMDKTMPLPRYETSGAAGMDMSAAIHDTYVLRPGETAAFPTGFAFAVPDGYELQIRSRSGIAAKNSVHVLNSPGTIDSDFRGELHVVLHNSGHEAYAVVRGQRIAQAVLSPVYKAELVPVDELDETKRGAGGFGSTGI